MEIIIPEIVRYVGRLGYDGKKVERYKEGKEYRYDWMIWNVRSNGNWYEVWSNVDIDNTCVLMCENGPELYRYFGFRFEWRLMKLIRSSVPYVKLLVWRMKE